MGRQKPGNSGRPNMKKIRGKVKSITRNNTGYRK